MALSKMVLVLEALKVVPYNGTVCVVSRVDKQERVGSRGVLA